MSRSDNWDMMGWDGMGCDEKVDGIKNKEEHLNKDRPT